MTEYDDIINLPHPDPKRHARMGAKERAAQFMPFAALTGYEALVKLTVAETTRRPELSDSEIEEINRQLAALSRGTGHERLIRVTYARERLGGADTEIVSKTGTVSRIDHEKGIIVLDGESDIDDSPQK